MNQSTPLYLGASRWSKTVGGGPLHWESASFPKKLLLALRIFFFVLLIVISLDVTYYDFASAIQDKNSYQDGNNPTIVGPGVGHSVDILLNGEQFEPPLLSLLLYD